MSDESWYNTDRLMTIDQAALYLNVGQRWVRFAVDERMLPFHKVGRHVRFKPADLEAYLQSNRTEAQS